MSSISQGSRAEFHVRAIFENRVLRSYVFHAVESYRYFIRKRIDLSLFGESEKLNYLWALFIACKQGKFITKGSLN